MFEQQFPGRFREFHFVSNANYEKSLARNKIAHSPLRFLTAVRFAENHPDLKAKRITLESIDSYINNNRAYFLSMVQVKRHLSEFLEETLQLFLIDS
jgi:hypothetical protein